MAGKGRHDPSGFCPSVRVPVVEKLVLVSQQLQGDSDFWFGFMFEQTVKQNRPPGEGAGAKQAVGSIPTQALRDETTRDGFGRFVHQEACHFLGQAFAQQGGGSFRLIE